MRSGRALLCGRRLALLSIALLLLVVVTSSRGDAAPCGPVYGADGIAVDSRGRVWITHYEDARVGCLDPVTRRFEEYLSERAPNPDATTHVKASRDKKKGFSYAFDSGFAGIALDETHAVLWTYRWNSRKLVRFSLRDHSFRFITLPGEPFSRGPIKMDSRGNLWLVTSVLDKKRIPTDAQLVQVAPDGRIIRAVVPPHTSFATYALAVDRHDQPWLAQTPVGGPTCHDGGPDAELYVLREGRFERQPVQGAGRFITGLACDAHGDVWFSCYDANAIGRLSSGKATLFRIPTPGASPSDIFVRANGEVWFTEFFGEFSPAQLGRLLPNGQFTEYPVPPEEEWVITMAFDGSGGVWFSTVMSYDLYRLDPLTGRASRFEVPVPSNWSELAASLSCSISGTDVTDRPAALPLMLRIERVLGLPSSPYGHPPLRLAMGALLRTMAASLVPGHPLAQTELLRSLLSKMTGEEPTWLMLPSTATRHPKRYPEPAARLFEQACTKCHTWYRVERVANRRSDWTATVTRMAQANGAGFLRDEELAEIIRYLNETYSLRADTRTQEGERR